MEECCWCLCEPPEHDFTIRHDEFQRRNYPSSEERREAAELFSQKASEEKRKKAVNAFPRK